VTVGAQGLKVLWVVVGPVSVDVIEVELAQVTAEATPVTDVLLKVPGGSSAISVVLAAVLLDGGSTSPPGTAT